MKSQDHDLFLNVNFVAKDPICVSQSSTPLVVHRACEKRVKMPPKSPRREAEILHRYGAESNE